METNAESKLRLHAIIEGHVQGVGFRYFVSDQAQRIGLTGWVRNMYDGQVEVVAEGVRSDLEELLKYLQSGPGGAYVSTVTEDWTPASSEYRRFSIAPTEF
ncbi:MAG: acylphosphatase [Anaerolineaceae bacterium]|jgi:acylphosphatase